VPLIITVDGPAASGKSTAAKNLAATLGVPYVTTGALYRAVTWIADRRGLDLGNARRLAGIARALRIEFRVAGFGRPLSILVDGRDVTRDLGHPRISHLTSARVAFLRPVRDAVNARTRRMAAGGRLVAEGRDCGSVVFPAAPYKFFLTASVAERARRRRIDLARLGLRPSLDSIRRDLVRRDRRDATRGYGAMVTAADAWVIDNTGWEPADTVAAIIRRLDLGGLKPGRRSGRMLPGVIRRALKLGVSAPSHS
jgi:cytidylate kinase